MLTEALSRARISKTVSEMMVLLTRMLTEALGGARISKTVPKTFPVNRCYRY